VGVTIEPFVTPLTSEGLPRIEKDAGVDSGPVIVKIMDLLDASSVAVTVALCAETDAFQFWPAVAVAVKVAVVAPDCTSTEAGTVKAETRLLDSATVVPPAGAAFETVTVQGVEAEAVRLALPHCSDVMVIGTMGATSERLAVVLTPFKLAVTDAG
jgi:hypothetical protein